MRRRTSHPSGFDRSTQALRLLRLADRNHADSVPTNGGPHVRESSPEPGRSTLTTSAPMSARYIAAVGPAYELELSITRIPASGSVDAVLSVIGRLQAWARPGRSLHGAYRDRSG